MAKQATTMQFEEALDRKLRLYKKASGMALAEIAGRAIAAYIDYELAHNESVRARYESEEAKLLVSAGISIIPRRKRKNGEELVANVESAAQVKK